MEYTDECQTNNQQNHNLTFYCFHYEIPTALKNQLNHLQNTMLRQINNLNISPKNFASKAIINGKTSSIHLSDKMNPSGILIFN